MTDMFIYCELLVDKILIPANTFTGNDKSKGKPSTMLLFV